MHIFTIYIKTKTEITKYIIGRLTDPFTILNTLIVRRTQGSRSYDVQFILKKFILKKFILKKYLTKTHDNGPMSTPTSPAQLSINDLNTTMCATIIDTLLFLRPSFYSRFLLFFLHRCCVSAEWSCLYHQ